MKDKLESSNNNHHPSGYDDIDDDILRGPLIGMDNFGPAGRGPQKGNQ